MWRRRKSSRATGSGRSATVTGLTVRDVEVHGFSSRVLWLQYDTNNVVIERVFGDGEYQDKDGIAEFNSIYPGYYIERATHIHFKAHIGNRSFLTNQAYLPEEINEAIYRLAPYNAPKSKTNFEYG